MSFFEKVKAKAMEELEALKADGRELDDKIHEIFHLGALHARLNTVEEKFRAEVQALKANAEAALRRDVARLRDQLNAEAAKIRDELKNTPK